MKRERQRMGNRGTGINMSRDDGLGRSLHSTGVIGIGIAIFGM
jgi:hypothetical protein